MNEREPLRLLQKHLLGSPFRGQDPIHLGGHGAWIDQALSALVVAARLFAESAKLLLPAQRALSLMAPKNSSIGAYEQLQAGLRTISPNRGEGFLRLFDAALEDESDVIEQPLGQGPFTALSQEVQSMSDALSLLDDVALALDQPSQRIAGVIVLKTLRTLCKLSTDVLNDWSTHRGLDTALTDLLLLDDDAHRRGVDLQLIDRAQKLELSSEFALLGLLTLPNFPSEALLQAGFNPRRVAVLMSILKPRP